MPRVAFAAFQSAYGPDGDWVQLFRQFEGYLGTALHYDPSWEGRYLTIDYWESEKDYRTFQRQAAQEYAELDRKLDALTEQETLIGEFGRVIPFRPSRSNHGSP